MDEILQEAAAAEDAAGEAFKILRASNGLWPRARLCGGCVAAVASAGDDVWGRKKRAF